MAKILYEVRVREVVGKDLKGYPKYQKKSKFYWARNAGEAFSHYKGAGHLMWVEKVSKEKVLGIGEFFRLGGDLMQEFRDEQKRKVMERRYLSEKRDEMKEVREGNY